MDVKSAFLNGDLKEEVYVKQPPGYVVNGQEHRVLRLRKAFTRCTRGGRALVVGVYVDDLVITGASKKEIEAFKAQMKKTFRMSDLGLLTYYLGIEVEQRKDGITLCQSSYARKLLERSGMGKCRPNKTPMEEKLKLSKDSKAGKVDATSYRSIVGGLRYLVHTRPDLAFAVGYVSRFMAEPRKDHQTAVQHILRYVAGTINYGLIYPRRSGEKANLIGYSDSDMGGDIDGRRSTSGMLFFLGGTSRRRRRAAIWLGRLLREVTGEEPRAPVLRVDNNSAIELAKNPVLHDRSKHIDIRFHYIRECVAEGQVVLGHVDTAQQLADLLTKPLGQRRLAQLMVKIGGLDGVEEEKNKVPAIAIVGRPNVGKSSILNALVGEDRTIVSPVSGTTRDAIDTDFTTADGEKYKLIDTAGIRRRAAVVSAGSTTESLSVKRAFRAIRRSDVVALVIEAMACVTEQDYKIAERIEKEGKACVIVVNKWDTIPNKNHESTTHYEQDVREKLRILDWAPVVYCSATYGTSVEKIISAAALVEKERSRRLGTSILNQVVREAIAFKPPPRTRGGKRGRVYYTTQAQLLLRSENFSVLKNDGLSLIGSPSWLSSLDVIVGNVCKQKCVADQPNEVVGPEQLVGDAEVLDNTSDIGQAIVTDQAATGPPTFVLFVNDAKLFPDTYRRYMEKKLRSDAGFPGTPIRLLWRSRRRPDKRGKTADSRMQNPGTPSRMVLAT
ncbi:hypothetical protein U9M48_001456 [Paspalum notatum var. saurae]|uniref:EngA-type G domain-containing protein n=1 Tax=Paspalum notatum var. saurae TaxID=547442 RepID=A0AAQ3SJ03_PASNO